MLRVKFVLVILLVINSLVIYGQHKDREIELGKLELKSEYFKTILDSIIEHEKNCDYYNPNLLFTINIKKTSEYASILIESIEDKNIAFELKPYGFFYRRNHLFLVEGNILSCLLTKTKIKTKFEYLEYDMFYEEYNDKGQRILRVIIDDSFSQWEFLYSQENFTLANKSTTCE